MKCIRCNRDSNYPERTNKKCPGCHHEFAFEPREGDLLTDMAFKNAVLAVSSQGAVRFTTDNLYYEICRRKPRFRVRLWLLVVHVLLLFVTVILAGAHDPRWFIGTGVLAVATAVAGWRYLNPPMLVGVARADFDRMYERWCKVHGAPEGVIVRKAQRKKHSLESDIGDYSFDRAVICDCDTTVDLLVANNFHFENNCAVLSVDGYPPGPFETVKAMLKRNPKLEVFVLHDASPKGCLLARKIATEPDWFDDKVKVTDVGLRPHHAKPFLGLYQEAQGRQPPEGEGVTAEETAWLAQYTLELAVIRPEQVLKRLFRAVNRKPEPAKSADTDGGSDTGVFFFAGGDGGGVFEDRESFSDDAGAGGDGGADSFG